MGERLRGCGTLIPVGGVASYSDKWLKSGWLNSGKWCVVRRWLGAFSGPSTNSNLPHS